MKSRVKGKKMLAALLCSFVFALLLSSTALADWKKSKSGKKIYYYSQTSEGETVRARGLTEIDGKTYYFNNRGVLQKGWVKTPEGFRYFARSGALGQIGVMYTGLKKIDGKRFYFGEDGVVKTGMVQVGKAVYYFRKSAKIGKRGMAVTKKFITCQGGRYYFGANGKMVKNRWVGNYYLGADGKKLVNTVTPDGYLVDGSGKKIKKLKTGLVKIDGKVYYWDALAGDFLKDQSLTIKGKKYLFDENGVGTAQASEEKSDGTPNILIVAGHGQGDSGAVSSLGAEYLKTREFANLVYQALKASGKVNAAYYKNGSTGYDLYQQNKSTLGSAGANLSGQITGKGSIRAKVLSAMEKNGNLPVLSDYDYVLEVHFNATVESAKDTRGDGRCKGFSFYINSYKDKTALEKKMCAKMRELGFSIFAGGVLRSSTLFNARICQEVGVDYSLVETAFIDDADDMKFYNKNKTAMAQAVADAIVSYYAS